MISQAPKGIVMNLDDMWYAVLLIELFFLVEYALTRWPRKMHGSRIRSET